MATYTRAATFPVNTASSTSGTITTQNVGDIVTYLAYEGTANPLTSITDSNSRITWQTSASKTFLDGNGSYWEIWFGVVTSTGSTVVTAHGTSLSFFENVIDSWSFPAGDSATWTCVATATIAPTTSVPVFASCTTPSTGDGGVYISYMACYSFGFAALLGVAPYTYLATTQSNGYCVYGILSNSTAYQGTTTSGSGTYSDIGVIFQATSATTPTVASQQGISFGSTIECLSARINPNSGATIVDFEYGATSSYGSRSASIGIGAGSSAVLSQVPVTGLTLGNTYHFRAIATNSAGSAAGGDTTFTTIATPSFNSPLGEGLLGAAPLAYNAGTAASVFTQIFTATVSFAQWVLSGYGNSGYGMQPYGGFGQYANDLTVLIKRAFPSTTSFVGTTRHSVIRSIAGAVSFVGTTGKKLGRKFATATLSSIGTLSRLTNRAMTGAVSFVGSIRRTASRSLAGAITFAGSTVRTIRRLLTGTTVTFNGLLSRTVGRGLSGALSWVGVISRIHLINQVFSAVLSFTGTVSKRTSRSITGALSFVGTTQRSVRRVLTGALAFVGQTSRSILRTLPGAVSFIGIVSIASQIITQVFNAIVSFTGTVSKQTNRNLAGALSFVGTTQRATRRALAGTLAFIGLTTRSTSQAFAAMLTFVGTLPKSTVRTLSGLLTFAGKTSRTMGRLLNGSLTFVGTTRRAITRALSGVLAPIGTLAKTTLRRLSGAISFASSIGNNSVLVQILTATVNFVSNLTTRQGVPSQIFNAVVSFMGTTSKQTGRTLGGLTTFIGSNGRRIGSLLSGTVTFLGTSTRSLTRKMSGAITFTGTTTRFAARQLAAGALSFVGTVTKSTQQVLSGAIAFIGTTRRSIGSLLTGTLSFAGNTTRSMTRKLVTATLSFIGVMGRARNKMFTALVSFGSSLRSATTIGRFVKYAVGLPQSAWSAMAAIFTWAMGRSNSHWSSSQSESDWTAGRPAASDWSDDGPQ